MKRIPLFLLLVSTSALTTGCAGTRTLSDPTVVIRTQGGTELGVSTDYGILFLGHTARSGDIEVTAWFGDGPSVEATVIEPIGAELYTAETEIRLPSVPMTFRDPIPGEKLLVVGRKPSGPWQSLSTVRSNPRVYGILLDVPRALIGQPDQIGAGVYSLEDDDTKTKRLLGLVSGRIRLITATGEREYLTVVGPEQLWKLVTHRRDHHKRKQWVYREDIL